MVSAKVTWQKFEFSLMKCMNMSSQDVSHEEPS